MRVAGAARLSALGRIGSLGSSDRAGGWRRQIVRGIGYARLVPRQSSDIAQHPDTPGGRSRLYWGLNGDSRRNGSDTPFSFHFLVSSLLVVTFNNVMHMRKDIWPGLCANQIAKYCKYNRSVKSMILHSSATRADHLKLLRKLVIACTCTREEYPERRSWLIESFVYVDMARCRVSYRWSPRIRPVNVLIPCFKTLLEASPRC